MPRNPYFNNYSQKDKPEQKLLLDLLTESIRMFGHDVQYIPRESLTSIDNLFGEDVTSHFTKSYTLDMYLANVEGYEGDGDFFSKFGLEIRDSSNFVVSWRTFNKYVPTAVRPRPREGDLIYVPVFQKLFEIKFVEEELMFFALGRNNPYLYELRCELFRYSNENISTGIDDVDGVADDSSYTVEISLGAGANNYSIGETVYQGNVAAPEFSAKLTDWNPVLKTIKVINTVGVVNIGAVIIGSTSNTRYTTNIEEDMEPVVRDDNYDNRLIQTEANTIIDFTESNIFGAP